MATDLVTTHLVKREGELLGLTGLHTDPVLLIRHGHGTHARHLFLMRRLNGRGTDQRFVQYLALVDECEHDGLTLANFQRCVRRVRVVSQQQIDLARPADLRRGGQRRQQQAQPHDAGDTK